MIEVRRAKIMLAVLAAARGFFVAAYDLILYSIVWGMWGDRFGRRSVLFGSIIRTCGYSTMTVVAVGVRVVVPAFLALTPLEGPYGRDLDYTEPL
jgi:hypothetical protein